MAKRHALFVPVFFLTVAASQAMAHPGHPGNGFAGGVTHPFSGADHVLAMVSVGLWAAQLGGRAVWMVPSAFVSLMVLGAGLARIGVNLPFVESGVMASVIVLGLMVALAFRVPATVAAAGVGLFALFHGFAHGTEMSTEAGLWSYGMGFTIATVLLHGAGIGLALLFSHLASQRAVQFAGGAIVACGGLLIVGF